MTYSIREMAITANTALLNLLLVIFGVSKRELGRPKRVSVVAVASILPNTLDETFGKGKCLHALLLLQQHLEVKLLMRQIAS